MSDIEHQLVLEVAELKEQLRELAELARRAVATAREAPRRARGRDPWLDDAAAEIDRILSRYARQEG